MFITKKHISRRALLRGAGVTLALPLLDSMIPAQTPTARTAAGAIPTRFTGIFVPHGMAPGYWVPEGGGPGEPKGEAGAKFKYPMIMEPLEGLREKTTIISGLWCKSAEPPPGQTGADHWVAAAYLCADKPRKTTGADVYDGTTIDQIIANKIGQESLMPSMQFALEDPGANASNCGEGYSCTYSNTISWSSPTQPIPMELDPQVAFERLFGSGGADPKERAARREQRRSILDSISQDLPRFKSNLGASDKARMDEWETDIREIERRLNLAKLSTGQADDSGFVAPAGVPESFDEHVKLHSDLTLLAYKADITRVTTMLYARDLTARRYPESKVNSGFHGASHHAENPKNIETYSHINQYHVKCMAYLAQKMRETKEGDGTMLDHSLILYGTNMGDSNQHLHYDVPHILVGGASGKLKGDRHLHFETKTVTTGNLLLSVLDMYGIHQDSIGDSTGRLAGLA